MKTNPIPLVVRLTQALACPVLRCIGVAGAQFRRRHLAVVGAPLGLALGLSQLALAQDPQIVQQPSSQTVYVGATVIFRTRATTTDGSISFQWQRDDPAVPVTFTNLPNANRSYLTLPNVTLEHAGGYRVIVANAAGESVTSDIARLEVLSAQFEDITQASGLGNLNAYCMGVAWGDYDNDGRVDLHIAAGGPGTGTNALYRNVGNGVFERVGAEAGPITTDKHSSLGCAWGDFDNDGHRDLFVVNGGWSGAPNDLYWNLGDGTFRRGNVGDLTGLNRIHSWHAIADYDGDGRLDVFASEAASGSGPYELRLYRGTATGTFTPIDFAPSVAYANDGVWGDFDNDGDPDLYACNFSSPSTLWRNDGKGQFTAMPDDLPAHAAALHAAWADYDNDGDLDIAIGSFSGVSIYSNEAGGAFVQATNFSGTLPLPAWADYDNDGHLDLLVVGGQDNPAKAGLFRNNGDGTFTPAADVFTKVADNWLGCAWGDIDDDGFMDLAMVHQQGRNALFRNLTNDNHWLKIKLVGTMSNRDAIGAKVRVLATIGGQPVWQMQEVNGGYQVQNDTRLNFGLGNSPIVTLLRVEWPSGAIQELADVAADRILTLWEPPALAAAVQPDGACALSIRAEPNRSWQIQASGDLLEWHTLTTMTSGTVGFEFVDSTATGMDCRFYRVMPE